MKIVRVLYEIVFFNWLSSGKHEEKIMFHLSVTFNLKWLVSFWKQQISYLILLGLSRQIEFWVAKLLDGTRDFVSKSAAELSQIISDSWPTKSKYIVWKATVKLLIQVFWVSKEKYDIKVWPPPFSQAWSSKEKPRLRFDLAKAS